MTAARVIDGFAPITSSAISPATPLIAVLRLAVLSGVRIQPSPRLGCYGRNDRLRRSLGHTSSEPSNGIGKRLSTSKMRARYGRCLQRLGRPYPDLKDSQKETVAPSLRAF